MDTDHDDSELDTQAAPADPTLHGHSITWNYSIRYWLPLLGPTAWTTWQTLIGFCYGHKDTCWPSVSLLADITAAGDRNQIKGRWITQDGERKRRPGAIETLEAHGLISVEPRPEDQRYTFHVLKEPPTLTPAQLHSLPDKLQAMHADLLHRCGIDKETYLATDHTKPAPTDKTTSPYADTRELEEAWRRVLAQAHSQVTLANFKTFLQRTVAYDYEPETGLLFVLCPDPLTAKLLGQRFKPLLLRAASDLQVAGRPIADLAFTPGRNYA